MADFSALVEFGTRPLRQTVFVSSTKLFDRINVRRFNLLTVQVKPSIECASTTDGFSTVDKSIDCLKAFITQGLL